MNFLPDLLDRPLRQFPNLLQNLFLPWPTAFEQDFPQQFFERSARIYEQNNHLHVELPLPGLNPKDIEVSLNKGVLIVKGESKEEEGEEEPQEEKKKGKDGTKKKKIYRTSRRSYSYSLALPAQIDEKQEPQAVYTDGILKISMKLAQPSEAKKIAVKTGSTKK